MEPADLGPDEVEALAKHEVRPDDLRLGYAAQQAAEELVQYKLSRLLAVSGASEVADIQIMWVCQGRAVGRKGTSPRRAVEHEVRQALPPAHQCAVCGVTADVRRVTVPYAEGFDQDEYRCGIHA